MLKFVDGNKAKIAAATLAAAAGLYLYWTKYYSPQPQLLPSLFPPLQSPSSQPLNSISSLIQDKAKTEESAAKERAYKALVLRTKRKIGENIGFVDRQLDMYAPANPFDRALAGDQGLQDSQLSKALAYSLSAILSQRFIHLIQLVRFAISQKGLLPIIKGEGKEETKSRISPMVLRLQAKPAASSQLFTGGNEGSAPPIQGSQQAESAVFCKLVVSFVRQIAGEVSEIVDTAMIATKNRVELTNTDSAKLLADTFNIVKAKYCSLGCREGMDPVDLHSYSLDIVSKFTTLLKEMMPFPSYGETKCFIESVYFQSLFMQGADMDFRELNAQYQKMVALAFQSKPVGERASCKELVAGIMKALKEWTGKAVSRYASEVEENTENGYIEKMMRFIASEFNQQQSGGDSISESYKQSLKEFAVLILFEEEAKAASLGAFPSLSELDFINPQQ